MSPTYELTQLDTLRSATARDLLGARDEVADVRIMRSRVRIDFAPDAPASDVLGLIAVLQETGYEMDVSTAHAHIDPHIHVANPEQGGDAA